MKNEKVIENVKANEMESIAIEDIRNWAISEIENYATLTIDKLEEGRNELMHDNIGYFKNQLDAIKKIIDECDKEDATFSAVVYEVLEYNSKYADIQNILDHIIGFAKN